MRATIQERGNGFCDVGDYVTEDGTLYRVLSMGSSIQTGQSGSGAPNEICDCEVEDADWSELTDEEADGIICTAVVATDDDAVEA